MMKNLRRSGNLTFPWLIVLAGLIILASGTLYSKKAMDKSGYLGVVVEELDRLEKESMGIVQGIVITEVIEDSPAEKAGLKIEDVIQAFDGRKIRLPADLVRYVSKTEPGKQVVIDIVRDGKKQKIEAVIGENEEMPMTWQPDKMRKMMFVGEPRVYLGVKLAPLNPDLAAYFQAKEEGALVLEVMADSPADKSGFKAGDVLLALNDEKVKSPEAVVEFLKDFEKGDEITIRLLRKGKEQTLKAVLDEAPGPRHIIKMGDSEHEIVIPDVDKEMMEKQHQLQMLHENMQDMQDKMHDQQKKIEIKMKSQHDPDVI
jgi:predicted metalloprotease with PDZ domain